MSEARVPPPPHVGGVLRWRSSIPSLCALAIALGSVAACRQAPHDARIADGGVEQPSAHYPNVIATADRSLIATRLAHLIWSTPPDDGLTAEVAALDPLDGEHVAGLASAMLFDDRAPISLAIFYHRWLDLDALSSAAKPPGDEISTELLDDMLSEVDQLVTRLTLSGGDFRMLFFSSSTFVNARLASHYGMAGDYNGTFTEVGLDGKTRLGLFTTAAVLARYSTASNPSWPARRGILVDDAILCAGLPTESPVPVALTTPTYPVRKAAEEAATDSSCLECHTPMNQAGYAFTAYDTLGRWDASHGPFDTSGFLAVLTNQPHFADLQRLFEILATSEAAERCFTRQWMTRALDVQDSGLALLPAGDPSVTRALAEFQASGRKLGRLIVEVTKTPAFLSP